MGSALDVGKHVSERKNWGTASFQMSSLGSIVSHIHFCAHANPENVGSDGQPATNHWTLFLETSSDHSVQLDVVPSFPTTNPGLCILSEEDVNLTADSVKTITCPTLISDGSKPQVNDILALIISKKRDQYKFTSVGEGCRFWLSTLAQDLHTEGIIGLEDTLLIQSALKHYWNYPSGSGSHPREILKGSFFD